MAYVDNPTTPASQPQPGDRPTPGGPTLWRRVRPHLAVLAFYTALTVLVAWPVLLGLGTGTPGQFPVDRNQNLWNMWWFKRSVFDLTNPYHTDFLFYPYGTNLYLHTLSPYNLLVGLPLQLLLGLVPAYGLLELLTFPLGGWGAWLLARYVVGDRPGANWGALLAGLVWSFGPYHWVELRQDQINLLSLQWLPFFLLFLFKLERATTRPTLVRYTLAAAFFYFLTLLVDFYYAIYLLMFAALYWLWQGLAGLWAGRRGPGSPLSLSKSPLPLSKSPLPLKEWARRQAGLTGRMAAAFGLGLLPFLPVLLATVRETSSPAYTSLQNDGPDQVHSADLLQLFLPPAHQPWWGEGLGLWRGLGLQGLPDGPVLNNWGAVLGYTALALSLYALWRVRGLLFWAAQGLFWLLISLGPTLRIDGRSTGVPLPYRLVARLPFVGIGRFPERYMLMAQLSLAILGAFGLARLLAHLPASRRLGPVAASSALGAAVLALFLLESWPGFLPPPLPVAPPAFIQALNTAPLVPAGRAILELPVTKHSNPDSPRMLYQIYHQRPITGGYISRDLLDPHREAHHYLLYDWFELKPPPARDIVPTLTGREHLALLDFAGYGFVVLYPDDFGPSKDRLARAQRWLDLAFGLNGQSALPFYQDKLARLYAVPPTSLDRPLLVLGRGWNEPEPTAGQGVQRWLAANESQAEVQIVVGPETPTARPYRLDLQLAAAPDKPRRLQILLNGAVLQNVTVEGKLDLKLEGLRLTSGLNLLALRPDPADGYYIPAKAGGDPKDTRQLRLAVLSLRLSGG